MIASIILILEPHVIIQDPQSLGKPSSPSLAGIGGIIGTLAGFAIAGTIALIIIKKRRPYKRSSHGWGFSDDSEVRFINHEEAPLDFTLAKPADDET